jgi:hypothetical protein
MLSTAFRNFLNSGTLRGMLEYEVYLDYLNIFQLVFYWKESREKLEEYSRSR